MFQKGFPRTFLGNLFRVGVSILHSAVFFNQVGGSFLSRSRDSRNIVCGISHKGFQFDNLGGSDLIMLQHLILMIALYKGLSLGCFWNTNQGFL